MTGDIGRELKSGYSNCFLPGEIGRSNSAGRNWGPATMLFLFGAVLLVTGLVTTHVQLVAGVITGVIGFLAMPAAIALFLHRHRLLMGGAGPGSSRAFG